MSGKRSILFIGAGVETIPGMRLAKEMGFHIVATDSNLNALGMQFANDRLIASTYDIDFTVAAVRNYHEQVNPISGVLCLGTDVPMTVSAVAKDLGLPGITRASALLSSDKLAMKDCFAAFGVPIPWYQRVFDPESVRRILNTGPSCLVIKPVDSRGARGVLKIDCKSDLDWAFSIAAENSPTGRVMVEAYLNGPQVSTESLVLDGKCFTPGFSDRNYEFLDRFAPNIIENGGDLPSFLSARQQLSIRKLVEDAAFAMGITNGVIKGDIVLFQGKPHVIELAARLSGGYFCTHEIPLNTGVNFVGTAIKQCLGDPINTDDLIPKFQKGVAQRFLFPQPGKVVSIDMENWILEDPDIALFEIRVSVGDTVQPAFNHPARAGVVIATGVNRQAAIQKAEAAVAATRIITQ